MKGKLLFALTAMALCSTACAAAQSLGPRDVDKLPSSTPQLVVRYGDGALQYGQLRLPAGKGPFPVAVVIHGGCWTHGLATVANTAPLASALTAAGVATWNIEYRQEGDNGGGFPGTFLDWSAGTDYLRVLARTEPIDLSRVVVMGHSAGAHAALWLASRAKLAATSAIRDADPLPLAGAIAIDGPGDLRSFATYETAVCGRRVLEPFFGGTASEQPERWSQGDPIVRVPFGVPQALVASVVLDPDDASAYERKATAAGDRVDVLEVKNGGHFDIIAPGTTAFATVEPFLVRFIARVRTTTHP